MAVLEPYLMYIKDNGMHIIIIHYFQHAISVFPRP